MKNIYFIIIAILVIIYVITSIKLKRIEFKNALLWILISIAMLYLAINPYFFDELSLAIGVTYPPALILTLCVVLLLLITFNQSNKITKLDGRIKDIERKIDDNLNHTFVILAYKESEYLEDCIKSVLNQSVKTNVVIATSTPNNYISNLAKKYNLDIIVNKESKGLAYDFNFALNCVDTPYVTIAHQDDIYENNYVKKILINIEKYPDSIILFTNYYEIKNGIRDYDSLNINVKEALLFLLKHKNIGHFRFIKRSALRFGNAICCPSVTFSKRNISITKIFGDKFKVDMDWYAWYQLSKIPGRFLYINEPLMGHRIHEESTTTKNIKDGNRGEEDLEMFKMFWPNIFAKIINRLYSNGLRGNKTNKKC